MTKLSIPYVRSSPKARVINCQDSVIELFGTHMTVAFCYKEEVPKDEEDAYLGTKERKGDSSVTILKSAVVIIETGWDEVAQRYDFTVFTHNYNWGFNCDSKQEALSHYERLTNWMLNPNQ